MRRDNHLMRRLAIALLMGFAVLVLLFPASGIDSIPPQCFSVFGSNVPCEARPWPAIAVGAATAAVVWFVLGLMDRRRMK
jgi:hypothetical protein